MTDSNTDSPAELGGSALPARAGDPTVLNPRDSKLKGLIRRAWIPALVTANFLLAGLNIKWTTDVFSREDDVTLRENDVTRREGIIAATAAECLNLAHKLHHKEVELALRERALGASGPQSRHNEYAEQMWNTLQADDKVAVMFLFSMASSPEFKKLLRDNGVAELGDGPAELDALVILAGSNPEAMRQIRGIMDHLLLDEAQQNSGRDMSSPNSPKVPFKWDTLPEYIQRSVDWFIRKEQGNLIEGALQEARDEAIRDPEQLQRMMDAYRKSPGFMEHKPDMRALKDGIFDPKANFGLKSSSTERV